MELLSLLNYAKGSDFGAWPTSSNFWREDQLKPHSSSRNSNSSRSQVICEVRLTSTQPYTADAVRLSVNLSA